MKRFRVIGFSLAVLMAVLVIRPFRGSAHIPITTKIMFNKEVVRILQRNCTGCHRPGGIAFSLETYDDARPWAKDMEYETLRRQMPPVGVVKGFGDFVNAPQITPRDLEVLVNWVENGVPEGNAKDFPKGPLHSDGWQLGTPDLILKAAEKTEVPAGSDVYKTLLIPTGLKQDKWIRAIDFRPGDGTVVHCATFYIQTASDEAPEKHCPGQLAGYWMPGQKTVSWPSGSAILLPAGTDLVMRVHYKGTDSAKTDQSEVGLYFSDKRRPREIAGVNIDAPSRTIPADPDPHSVTESVTLQENAELLAIRPATNPLVISLQATAYRPDGSAEVLVWSKYKKSDWSPLYCYRRPVRLPRGTRVEATIYFDNSNKNKNNSNKPAKPVLWSNTSADPLCSLLVVKPESCNP